MDCVRRQLKLRCVNVTTPSLRLGYNNTPSRTYLIYLSATKLKGQIGGVFY